MYMNGQGTTPNLIMAYYWVSLSVAQGNQNAPAARDYLAEKMTAEQIEEANRLVRAKLSEGGSP
jgi:TPR repeat protein